MTKFHFTYLGNYKNHGQDAEQSVRFILTGEICKADNLAHHLGADCLNFQIKSARATVCNGTDLLGYLAMDAATAYIYATCDGTAYVMSKEEYIEFVTCFGVVDHASSKNGGADKLRLKHEGKAMLEWLRGGLA